MKVSAHLALSALLALGASMAARPDAAAAALQPPAEPSPPTEAPEPAAQPAEAAGERREEDPEAPVGDADDAAGTDEDAAGEATLKVECDLDCTVTVGLQPPAAVEAGKVLTVKIEPGAVRVSAFVTEITGARTFEDVTVAAGERQRVRLKMVKALEELRKVEARDRTFRDIHTRLMWPTRDNGVDLEWQEALDYCAASEHGGWDDWRLPTLPELEDIEAMWSLRAFKTADPITLSSCCAWSADRIDEERAWNFNYRFRRPFEGHVNYSLSLRALCVRDGSAEIPENTRRNRRLAKREAKERQREKELRQQERDAAKAEAAAAAEKDDGAGGA